MKSIVALVLVSLLCFSFSACGVCEVCNGNKRIRCSNCYEGIVDCEKCTSGLINPITCDKCNGDKYKLVDCSKCNGSGKIVNPITWQSFECSYCDGKMYEKDYCDECDGDGMFGTDCEDCYDGTVTCEVCQGDYYQDCTACE